MSFGLRTVIEGGLYASHTPRDPHRRGAVLVPAPTLDGPLGTTSSDLTRLMAGDGLIVKPTFAYTMAATVNAQPEHIWPWLVQMGYQRNHLNLQNSAKGDAPPVGSASGVVLFF